MRPERGRNKRLVLAALEMGTATATEIERATGLSKLQVHSVLIELVKAGVVERAPAAYRSMKFHENVATKDCDSQLESA